MAAGGKPAGRPERIEIQRHRLVGCIRQEDQ
jgi:hypothetical protein